ncbi:MAG: 2-oxoacid:acceptor oxidoreductase family protein [Thermogemmata sp.]|jgi:pyruvate-ferredoxin/flavodoxin oxidoreductase|uniref:2-oxoacid:acceptor oxidoreductase family protein n=1 Tax=Thermogemmata fonticola TaxID=2755323 RepID=A0A7V9AAK3_9BACT|nr:2-oxoacid:acceptor oxidoreductase family protein [Thermogemmata fonticola]MBA2225216.1 2-oxoacid:acceptor oxidoreductase family protein [Thermogemmata fonticola]
MSIAVAQAPIRTPEASREAVEASYQYPGIPTTCDGAEAVVHVETHISQAAGAYPITSSTTMGGGFNAAVMNGAKNLWGDPLMFFEPESEHSAASICEGFAVAGGRVTNFTSGQGLVLMKEVLYTIAGKRLPVVMNIGARALTSQGLNVHAGHDDVMSVADCGWGMLFARNAQEAGDFCLICRRVAEATFTPFFNIQDGFLTTHTVETVRLPEPEFMKEYVGNPKEKLINLMDPANPMMSGVVQNQDSYMKGKIAQRWYYDRIAPALEDAFDEFARKTGRRYGFVEPYRCEDAEYILVGMGCYMETAKAVVDYLREKKGIAAGCLTVFVFRPFPARHIVEALKNCTAFTVLERMDDPLSTTGNHLTREIKAAFCDAMTGQNGQEKIDRIPRIYHGSAGLGSRDVRPGDLIAAFHNMMIDGPDYFCVGIDHPLALKVTEDPDLRPSGAFSMRGHSVGGFGSVTTNKVIATIAGNVFGKDVQAYPKYGSEKKGLPTTYYLTIADSHINLHSELERVELLVINDPTAILSPLTLKGLVPGGAIFMQSPYSDPAEVWKRIPDFNRRTIRENNIRVYYCDMVRIAREVASEPDLQMRMQGIVLLGAFLRLTPYAREAGMTDEQVYAGVEKALRKYFGKRGDQVVQENLTCVKRGYSEMKEIPRSIIAAE